MNNQLQKVLVLFVIRKNTLYCRITVNQTRCNNFFSINERVKPPVNKKKVADGEWDCRAQQVKGKGAAAQLTNTKMEQIRSQIRTFAMHLAAENKPYSADKLKSLYLGKSKLTYTLLHTSEMMLDYMRRQPEDEVAKGTLRGYLTRHNNMVEYLKARNHLAISPEDFAPSIARDFLQYMRQEHLPHASQVHACKCLEYIKKVIKYAINQEWIKYNPLQSFTIKKARHKMTPHLSESERRILEQKTFSIERLQRIKDIFVFCCHTGLSFADVKLFRASQHLTVSKNLVWLEMKRAKTEVDFYVPLSAIAQDILHQYGGEKLPVPSNVNFNSYLKEVGQQCGITVRLTVRVARTTFGSVLLNELNTPLETVSKMLGHSSVKITELHYAQVLKKKIVRDMVVNNPLLYETIAIAPTVRSIPLTGFRMVRPVATIAIQAGE